MRMVVAQVVGKAVSLNEQSRKIGSLGGQATVRVLLELGCCHCASLWRALTNITKRPTNLGQNGVFL